MSAFGLPKVSAAQARGAYGQVKRRCELLRLFSPVMVYSNLRFVGMHGSLKRQAIMMPAMSPLMTEGTITRWKKKEGEAFAAGDVLLQIVCCCAFLRICTYVIAQESDIAMIDVEAHTPGILGKILVSSCNKSLQFMFDQDHSST